MAAPLSPDALVRALRAEGCTVVEHPGWRTNRRPASTGAWGPVNGVMIHHTVTSGTDASVRLCFNGRSDLPGPLCHGVIAKDGTVHLVGGGRANHAGRGDDDVLAAVVQERDLPPTNENNTDGNAHFYGFEAVNLGDGKDPWPAAQLEAIERAAAALCRAHEWSARSVIAHKEWTNTKIDPRGFSMADMRGRIADRLAGAPTDTEEDPLAGMSKRDIYDGVWETDAFPAPGTSPTVKTNPTWKASSVLADISNRVRSIDARTAAQEATITELTRTVAQLAVDRGQQVDVDALVARIREAIDSIEIRLDTTQEA